MMLYMTGEELQRAISRNVKVLMAIRQIDQQRELAAALGMTAAELSRKLSNKRRWHLDDIAALAGALRVLPEDVARADVTRVAGAAQAEGSGSSATIGGTIRYESHRLSHLRLVSPLVSDPEGDSYAAPPPATDRPRLRVARIVTSGSARRSTLAHHSASA
jgi:hypothetical protein